MHPKHKKGAWLMLASFILSSFLPPFINAENNSAEAATVSGYALEGIAFYANATKQTGMTPVYRLYSSATTDHIYTTSEDEKTNAINKGYAVEPSGSNGIAFYAYPNDILSSTAPQNNIVAGTDPQNIVAGTSPQDNIVSGTAPDSNITSGTEPQNNTSIVPDGIVPVYRLYNESFGSRLYTASTSERDNAINNSFFLLDPPASADGIAFYAYPASVSATFISANNLVAVYRFYNSSTGDYIYTTNQAEKDTTAKTIDPHPELGPEISVGLFNTPKSDLNSGSPFKIHANKNYNIKDASGNILAEVSAGTETRVTSYTSTTTQTIHEDDGGGGSHHKKSSKHKKKKKKKKKKSKKTTGPQVLGVSTIKKYITKTIKKITKKKKKKKTSLLDFFIPTAYASDRVVTINTEYLNIKIRRSDGSTILEKQTGAQELYFDSTDGDNSDMIFDVSKPGSQYDQYRGKVKIKYTDDNNIWMINVLPLEQYVWGIGETSGQSTDIDEYYKAIIVIYRTYGKWYVDYATKYLPYGFRILSTSSSQIYSGYDHENARILGFAKATRGVIVTYKGETALTPYSSWSDGRTRSYEERWGSTDYPWCQSVPDPYGNWYADPSHTTPIGPGNHMVGFIANGGVNMARSHSDQFKTYKDILNYYYKGVDLSPKY